MRGDVFLYAVGLTFPERTLQSGPSICSVACFLAGFYKDLLAGLTSSLIRMWMSRKGIRVQTWVFVLSNLLVTSCSAMAMGSAPICPTEIEPRW
eukprot:6456181-Amphidinium_carterae.1